MKPLRHTAGCLLVTAALASMLEVLATEAASLHHHTSQTCSWPRSLRSDRNTRSRPA